MSFEECLQAASGIMKVIPTDGIEYEDAYLFFADPEQFTSGQHAVAVMKEDGSVLPFSEYEKEVGQHNGWSFIVEYQESHYRMLEEREIPRPEWRRPNA